MVIAIGVWIIELIGLPQQKDNHKKARKRGAAELRMEALVPYAGTNRIRSAGISQL